MDHALSSSGSTPGLQDAVRKFTSPEALRATIDAVLALGGTA
jgi:hypothetical protein